MTPCIWPEMPYCPACKYGLIILDENDDTHFEEICLCTEEDLHKEKGGDADA